jgi:type II secretory pathway pseudopilin PulG
MKRAMTLIEIMVAFSLLSAIFYSVMVFTERSAKNATAIEEESKFPNMLRLISDQIVDDIAILPGRVLTVAQEDLKKDDKIFDPSNGSGRRFFPAKAPWNWPWNGPLPFPP